MFSLTRQCAKNCRLIQHIFESNFSEEIFEWKDLTTSLDHFDQQQQKIILEWVKKNKNEYPWDATFHVYFFIFSFR